MGYYNCVRILVSEEGFKNFKQQVEIACAIREIANPMNELDIQKTDRSTGVYFGWDDIKWFNDWYEPYVVVASALQSIKEHGYSYRLSRIGEEFDDIEEIVFDGELAEDLDYISIVREFDDERIM